jgi:xylose dehydrogenase (NAD/NADP)
MPTPGPVRFGVLGAGRIAQHAYAPAFAASDRVALHGAASRDPARAAALQPQRVHESYAALIADSEIEAVLVATHNGLHRDQTLAALAAGKHVLCEKPFARDAAEAVEMARAAEAAGRHVTEAFMYRHDPRIQAAVALVAAGRLGAVQRVSASFTFGLVNDTDVRWRRDWGGGALLDVGSYCVNACRAFFGAPPDRVQATGRFHPEHDVDVLLHGLLDFGDGRCGIVACGFETHGHQHLSVIGTRGVLDIPDPFFWGRPGAPAFDLYVDGRHEHQVFSRIAPHQRAVEDLARAIRTDTPPLLPSSDAVDNMRVLDALLQSARTRCAADVQ